MSKNILIIGSGGREAALEYKLGREKSQVGEVFTAPGNGGSGRRVDINADDFEKLAKFAYAKDCLVIFGSENQLAKGGVNYMNKIGIRSFGPTAEAASLESDKVRSKNFMVKNGIPTPKHWVFDNRTAASSFATSVGAPIVVKYPYLSGGKGVYVCTTKDAARVALDKIMTDRTCGAVCDKIIIEEFVRGREVTVMYLVDGKKYRRLAAAQDQKKLDNSDLNTGGMGSYSPVPFFTLEMQKKADGIMEKTLSGLQAENVSYKGVIYLGIMLPENKQDDPVLLEYNSRFGDPETQTVLARMESDLYPYLEAVVEGRLDETEEIKWKNKVAACLVLASKGYPEKYEVGKPIYGLNRFRKAEDVFVYHSGTIQKGNRVYTNGGRVLSLVVLGDKYTATNVKLYTQARKIGFDGMIYNKNVLRDALSSTGYDISF